MFFTAPNPGSTLHVLSLQFESIGLRSVETGTLTAYVCCSITIQSIIQAERNIFFIIL